MERRIAPPGTSEIIALLDKLTSPTPGPKRAEGIFRSKQKVLMFAAVLGVKMGERRPLQKRAEPIRYGIFEGALDDTFVNAIAIAETGDLKILSEDHADERIQIFEEYAHAGLVELQKRLAMPGEDLQHILQLVMDVRAEKESPPGVIPGLANLFNF
jgi:dnd system-associated protein 4